MMEQVDLYQEAIDKLRKTGTVIKQNTKEKNSVLAKLRFGLDRFDSQNRIRIIKSERSLWKVILKQ